MDIEKFIEIEKQIKQIREEKEDKTNYQKILHFYNEFGIKIPAEPYPDIFNEDPVSVVFALDNVKDYIYDYTEALEIPKISITEEDDAGSMAMIKKY